ncbi:MAG: efflux RND transporter periplasmic adaptor subunit [Deltaproteobacteria bacterium]|nr:efflux RND transporter periplasmic adaptor subunit [Deltaproteobacteria bacterium]
MCSRRLPAWRYALPAVLLLACLLPALGCDSAANSNPTPPPAVPAVKVTVQEIQPVAMRDVLVLPGQTEGLHEVVVAAEAEGKVERIPPKEGEEVAKGALLAEIDVAERGAALARAKAAYKLADGLAQRRENLKSRKVLAQEDLDRAETERQLAKGNLDAAQILYDQSFLRTPVAGVVNKLYVDPGEFAKRGEPVAEIVNTRSIKVNLSVPELDVRFLSPGQAALVTVDAYPGRQWPGRLDFISFKADFATKTFPVKVIVDNPDGAIRPGMVARVALLRREVNEALAVPLRAILDKAGERIVFVARDGVARSRTVELGIIEGERIQVTKGLAAGDQLIVSGHNEVEDGMKVSLQ